MKVLIDISTKNHKGLGRFTSSLMKALKELPIETSYYKSNKHIYDLFAFLRIVPISNWDIFISPHLNISVFTLIAFKPIYITIHDVIPFEEITLKSILIYLYLYFLIRIPYVNIITVSNYSKEEIINKFRITHKKIYIIHNQSEIINKISSYQNNPHKIKLLMIGNLKKHKNHKLLIKAVKIINDTRMIDVKLNIVGGFNPNKIYSDNLNLNESFIDLYGDINDKELIRLIHECDILIQPSLSEGFGIPILEGLLLNKPIICSDIKVFNELFGDNVTFFNPHDPILLYKLIIQEKNRINSKIVMNELSLDYSLEKFKKQLAFAIGL